MTYAPDHALIATPIGAVEIWGDDGVIARIAIPAPGMRTGTAEHPGSTAAVREAEAQLRAYFAGTLQSFDLPLTPSGSNRGEILRNGIAAVGYGNALSYGALARLLDSGPRAIGQACARNPFPLVIPCHRILAAGRKLGAYSAGKGPATKRWLLDHEIRHSGKAPQWAA
jgi:methylated-DNA-[protein]-cysteine S-methyltransferase